MLWTFHGGLHLDGHKAPASEQAIIPARIPKLLVLPLLQHIGTPAKPIVQPGEKVLKGQIVARCCVQDCSVPQNQSVPIHAPTSGTVVAIEPRPVPHPSGLSAECVVIESDGADQWIEHSPLDRCDGLSADELRLRIAKAGLVGLGGAGFPSHLKLLPHEVHTLILNGAECEPYISCDDRLMREQPLDIVIGARVLAHALGGIKRCVIALEDNKPQARLALRQAARDSGENIEVVEVPTLYPMGGEKQLIRVLTGIEIPAGNPPVSRGIVVHNVATAAAVFRAVRKGEPLISRIVTITGGAVQQPRNLEVLLGTPIQELLDQCGLTEPPANVVVGGPMMGFHLPDTRLPVIKTTNCVIAYSAREQQAAQAETPCIRCGRCEDACPVNLLPQQLYWHSKAKNFDKAMEHHLLDCIECGCCAYVCPSQLPLAHYFRYAKGEARVAARERSKADIARHRHEFREFRLEREKAERQARHQQKRAVVNSPDSGEDAKKAAIAEAVARAEAKKADQAS
jgi:electron transport complex protein RnfC